MKKFVVEAKLEPFIIESKGADGDALMEAARKELLKKILSKDFDISFRSSKYKENKNEQMEFDFVKEAKWVDVSPVDCWLNE